MTDPDLINVVLVAAGSAATSTLGALKWFALRGVKQHDDIVQRLTTLERESVTVSQLEAVSLRLENRIDAGIERISQRLDRILDQRP